MKVQHPDFWQDIVGQWEIIPAGSNTAIATVFKENMSFSDPERFLCGGEATPNYWTGQTPEGTVFEADQAHRQSPDRGKVSLQKMQFKRGQFMLVCNGRKMNYEDHIVFYGLSATEAGLSQIPGKGAESRFGLIRSEDGRVRRFTYRRPG